MKVAIVGSRDYEWLYDYDDEEQARRKILGNPYAGGRPKPLSHFGAIWIAIAVAELLPGDYVVSGGATGADWWGEKNARDQCVGRIIHEADWEQYGKPAGPIRNALIVRDADVVLAFYSNKAKSRGTINCITQANKKGIPVYEFDASTQTEPAWRNDWYDEVMAGGLKDE